MDNERTAEKLMTYRVRDIIPFDYRAIPMTRDEIIKRRALMRQILIGTKFGNANNEKLDSMRINKTSFGYIVEDEEGRETALGYTYDGKKVKAEFRETSDTPFER